MREPRIKREIVGEYWSIPIFECEVCGGEMTCWEEHNNKFYCPDCAFKEGLITEEEFIEAVIPSIYQHKAKAIVHDGEIYIAYGKEKFEFEKGIQDYRQTKEYRDWRSMVFERDNFTCQICGKVGGSLNAHHIKKFNEYPKLRFEVSNGVTLCEKCHRELHKRERNGNKKSH